jgi:tetratricopeptide (TPR) repeat protein
VDTYRWNGRIFIWDQLDIDPPVNRYQAVQDGDRLSLLREYPEALELYQEAIFSDQLLAWSYENYWAQLEAGWEITWTPTPVPVIQEEYDHLAAYARYRIMLLHVQQEDIASARIVYDSLSEEYPEGRTGYAFVEMADAFWRGYEPHANIGEGCLAVTEYAEANKSSLFTDLGGTPEDFYSHGTQSHIYLPGDTCPFE